MGEFVIDRLGRKGDGLVDTATGVISVPLALPGEQVTAGGDPLVLEQVITPSPHRVEPICPLFGSCGGCATQHADGALNRRWKRDLVIAALAHAGLDAPVAEVIEAHGAGRRRVTWHLRWSDGGWHAGFMARGTHRLIAIPDCPILTMPLRGSARLAEQVAGVIGGLNKPIDMQITATATGLDIDLRGTGPLPARREAALIEAAGRFDLARLSLHGKILVERRPPLVTMGAAQVTPTPGGFLQATEQAETILFGLVSAALQGRKKPPRRVADLFAGVGPFALRLAASSAVHAVESDDGAVAALLRGARATPGLKPVSAEARDLYRRPLLEHELATFDAVMLDPPRNGAEMQCRRLAASSVPLVVYVSCDPQSFARDAALLIAGGYRLTGVTPVDQFRYAPHIELVGTFSRTA